MFLYTEHDHIEYLLYYISIVKELFKTTFEFHISQILYSFQNILLPFYSSFQRKIATVRYLVLFSSYQHSNVLVPIKQNASSNLLATLLSLYSWRSCLATTHQYLVLMFVKILTTFLPLFVNLQQITFQLKPEIVTDQYNSLAGISNVKQIPQEVILPGGHDK